MKSWRDIPITVGLAVGLFVGLGTAATVTWGFLNSTFMRISHAAEAHKETADSIAEIIRRDLREVRKELRAQRLYRAKVESDKDLNEKERALLVAEIDLDIEDLQREEKCLDAGKLRCE